MKRYYIAILSIITLFSMPIFSHGNSVDYSSKKETKAQRMVGESIPFKNMKKSESDYRISTPLGNFDPVYEEEPAIPQHLKALSSDSGNAQFIVQFGDYSPQSVIDLVEQAGGEVYGYYHSAAIKVKLPVKEAAQLKLKINETIRSIVPVHPAYKIDKGINTKLISINEDTNVHDNIAILVWNPESKKEIVELIEASGGKLLTQMNEFSTLLEATIPLKLINDLAFHENVVYIQRAGVKKMALDEAHTITDINLSPWNYGWSGFGETIAIVDSGIDTAHPSFNNKIVSTIDYGNLSAITDTDGHGTHVANIAAGSGASSSGNNKRGFAYDATILNQAYLGCANCPSLTELHSNAWDRQVRISNNSWVYDKITPGQYDAYAREIDSIVRNQVEGSGIPSRNTYIIVHASGNDGTLDSPNSAKNIISVGTSYNTKTGNINQLPNWSGGGSTADGRHKKPDIVAPGADIVSARSSNSGNPHYQGNSFYTLLGGTSMAAPQVSGAAAIFRELYDHVGLQFPTASLIKAQLINGAVLLSDSKAGWGRLNVHNSFGKGQGWFYSDELSVFEGSAYRFYNTVTDSSVPLKVTLAWIDLAGDPANANTDVTVNDLDLYLISPSGIQYSSNSTKETVEQVVINNPETGEWQVLVHGYDVFLAQQFSLVSTYE